MLCTMPPGKLVEDYFGRNVVRGAALVLLLGQGF